EAVKLKLADIGVARKCLLVRQGKGGKDRMVIVSETFLRILEEFLPLRKRESDYLFHSGRLDKAHISVKTAEKVVENAASRAGINAYCHALRSSFATHLIENGTDVHYVQRLLGHSSIRTTQGYLRVADSSLLKVKSPIDCYAKLSPVKLK
ncbi:MAG TPA: tyrosine-type recombinase/integrase, partial [Candidatus Nanoarchaeia archaeon]|nr:tyrosine-type recombinase/integrase [Candidatus Nanoarchaeia archaeon]